MEYDLSVNIKTAVGNCWKLDVKFCMLTRWSGCLVNVHFGNTLFFSKLINATCHIFSINLKNANSAAAYFSKNNQSNTGSLKKILQIWRSFNVPLTVRQSFVLMFYARWLERQNVHAFNLEYWKLQSFNWAKRRVRSVLWEDDLEAHHAGHPSWMHIWG